MSRQLIWDELAEGCLLELFVPVLAEISGLSRKLCGYHGRT
ncbi:hypothetical protein ACLUEY_17110 [Vreelandella aquamarina]